MEKSEILERLTPVFRKVFNNQSIKLNENLTANDIENWDSLTHMILITEIESCFSIKFKLRELNKMKNVGEMAEIISQKV
jgi:acyl carrier protein